VAMSGWLAVSKATGASVFLSNVKSRAEAEATVDRIYGLDRYEARWTDAWTQEGPEEQRCDFCSGQPVMRRLKIPNFEVGTIWMKPGEKDLTVQHRMIGDWLACSVCWDLIQRRKFRLVTVRSAQTFAENDNVPEDRRAAVARRVFPEILPLHEEVWRNWLGESEPVTEKGGES